MKRLALLVASVAALMLFTACEPRDGYCYVENISMTWETENGDTSRLYCQQFRLSDNKIIYDPCSPCDQNSTPFMMIGFYEYCQKGETPMLHIRNDSIDYDDIIYFGASWLNHMAKPSAKIIWNDKHFSFSYPFGNTIVTHDCHRVKKLPN